MEKSKSFASSELELTTFDTLIFFNNLPQIGQSCFLMQKIGLLDSDFQPSIFILLPPINNAYSGLLPVFFINIHQAIR